MERVYTVTDVAETVILGTLEERGGRITPNPFSRQIQVDFPAELGKIAEVKVMDLQGKQHDSTREISSGEILDLSYLSPGTYFLRVESLDHRQVFSQKLVKIP
jgi:hypothetical protein